ncbi:hypothetical protein ES703_95457 [subsurface metagenome]
MNEERLIQEIDYLGSTDEYLAFVEEHFGLEPEAVRLAIDYEKYCDYGCGYFLEFLKDHSEFNTIEFQEYVIVHNKADRDSGELADIAEFEIWRLAEEFAKEKGIKWVVKKRAKIEPPAWEEVLAADGMGGIWEEELAKKKRPQDYPKGRFHIDDHARGKSSHKDIRIKRNDHLEGWTVTDQVEGAIDERIDSVSDWKKYPWNDPKIFKFQPDMGDKNVKCVAIKKAQQPLVWLNVRNVAFPPGSVGATKLEWGVFRAVDEGMAYMGVKKSYFNEWFLDGKHFKGRLIFRLIPVRPEWRKKPKAKLQWQTWLAASTPKGQLPYLLSPRGRSRKDVAPPERESWLPPEWEKKIKAEHRWWPDSKSKQEKIKLIDEAYNDLIEKGEIKARKLKLSEELQTDTAVVLMTYGELKAKGWKDEQIIEQIAKNLLPIGFTLDYWKKKVKEILRSHGILQRGGVIRKVPAFEEIHGNFVPKVIYDELKKQAKQRGLKDFEYLLHHIHTGEKEEIHHCLLCDHIANMFEQAHLLVKGGKVYIDGKLIKEGIFHIIKGLEPTQEVTWSDMEARENKIKPKAMKSGMSLKEKAREW